MLVTVFAVLVVLTLALVLLALPAGIYTCFFTQLSGNFSAGSQVLGLYLFVGPAAVLLPVETSLGSVFVTLTVIYAAMLLLAALQGRGLFSSFRAAYKDGFSVFFSNTLLVTMVAIGFFVFTVVLLDTAETSSGIPIGSLSGDPFRLFNELAIAPLREELGFRVLIIGVLALVACVGLPLKTAARALWRPSVISEVRGRDAATTGLLVAGLVISAVTFGLVHVLSNIGWEIGKLPAATYGGFVLGYLYIKYGFHVAVLTHWGLDFLSSVFYYLGQGAPTNSWASNAGYFLDGVLSLDLVSMFGLACFLLVGYVGLKRIVVWRRGGQA